MNPSPLQGRELATFSGRLSRSNVYLRKIGRAARRLAAGIFGRSPPLGGIVPSSQIWPAFGGVPARSRRNMVSPLGVVRFLQGSTNFVRLPPPSSLCEATNVHFRHLN